MPWDKKEDTIAVSFPTSIRGTAELTESTKREVLRTLARVFDPLGIAAPILLTGKNIFHGICDRKMPWDKVLPYDLKKTWEKWLQSLPKEISVPRSIISLAQAITSLDVHGFGDASV